MNVVTVPRVGEAFTLALKDSSSPIRMVRDAGHEDWQRWKYMGTLINGVRTYTVKLIPAGPCINLKEAREITEQLGGETLSGLILDSFYEAFPVVDDEGPIVVVDDSWLDPSKVRQFPIIFRRDAEPRWARDFRPSLAALAELHHGCRLLVGTP